MKELRHLCQINNLRYAGIDAYVFLKRLTKHLAKVGDIVLPRVQGVELFSDAMVSIVVKVNVVTHDDETQVDETQDDETQDDETQEETWIKLTVYNVHKYVGHSVRYKSRGFEKEHNILDVSSSGKSIKINNDGDLKSFLQITTRNVYVNVVDGASAEP